jgi:hypothetical protein
MTTIVTHTSPDFDAIGAVWLLLRYTELRDSAVAFVHTGNPDPDVLANAVAVVDTGRVYDPERWRFDHHQFGGSHASQTSATELVWQAIGAPMDIRPLIDLITDCDGRDMRSSDAFASQRVGIHALLSALKAQRLDDRTLLARGMDMLDLIAATLIRHAQAARALAAHTVWVSPDMRVVALLDAPKGATHAAFDQGAELVVFADTTEAHTVAVGCARAHDSTLHCGELVRHAMTIAAPAITAELQRWYQHEAGFFAGRGTAKAPDPTPLTVEIGAIATVLAHVRGALL